MPGQSRGQELRLCPANDDFVTDAKRTPNLTVDDKHDVRSSVGQSQPVSAAGIVNQASVRQSGAGRSA